MTYPVDKFFQFLNNWALVTSPKLIQLRNGFRVSLYLKGFITRQEEEFQNELKRNKLAETNMQQYQKTFFICCSSMS